MKSFFINIITFIITTVALLVVSTNTYADEITDFTKIDIHLTVQTTSDKLDKNLSYQLKSAEGRVFYLTLTYRYELGKSYTNVLTTTVLYSDYKFTLNSQEVVNTCNGPNGLRYFWYADGSLVGNKRGQKVVASNTQYYVDVNEYNPNIYDNASVNQTIDSIVMNFLQSGKMDSKIIDLSKNQFDESGNIVPVTEVYDLEVPQNFRVKQKSLVDLGIVEMGKDDTFYLSWEQSENIDNNGWVTEIYFKDKGYAKKEWYSLKKYKYECKWSFYNSVPNYKNKAKFNIENVNNLEEIKEIVGFKPYSTSTTKLDFMIRNKWVDEVNGITHYSNYVYLDNSNGSGSSGSSMDFNGYEVDGKEFDKGNFDDENINNNRVTDSDSYDGSNVSGNTSSNDVTSAISILKSITNDIKEFPAFFSNFFSFIPDHFVYALSALIVATIGIAFLKAVL